MRTGATPGRAQARALLLLCLAAATGSISSPAGGEAPPELHSGRRILLLSSFGNEFSYFAKVVADFRSELDRIEGRPCDCYEVALELSRFDSEERQEPFVDYLNAIVSSRRPELIVTFGGPAARFARLYRDRLFPGVPVLYAAVDSLHVDTSKFGALDASVPVTNDLTAVPEAVLSLLPDTRHLAILLGSSPLEKF